MIGFCTIVQNAFPSSTIAVGIEHWWAVRALQDMQLPEDIITESLSVPQEMAALAETIKNPDTLPEIVFHQLRFLVGLIAPEDRELSRAAMVKTGVVPHIVQMLELPTGPEGSKTLPSEERLKLMPVALQAIFYLLRQASN